MSAVEQIGAFEAQACSSRTDTSGDSTDCCNRHIDMSRESKDCFRTVTLPEAAQAVVEQTSPEAAQADVE
jgi:hypothetical protein